METATSADDGQRLRALHDDYAGPLWSFVVHLTGDRNRAQDVVQETLLRAWRHPEVLAQDGGSARAWLFTVARRIVIDEWRSGRSRYEVVAESPPDRPDGDRTDALLDTWLVEEALHRLSPRPPGSDRRVLLPRALDRRGRAGAADPRRHGQVAHATTPCERCASPFRRWG